MDQVTSTVIAAAVPTLAIIAASVRNETSLSAISTRITNLESALTARITMLEQRFDQRIETLDCDLRKWARITMQHNTNIARLKDKIKLDDK